MADKSALKLAGVLSAIKLRNGPRGRSAFLTLSDAYGQYEVAVFDESLLNDNHAILKAGTPLFLGIDVRHGERGQRLLVNRLDLLDNVAGQMRAQQVSVTVEDVSELHRLKTLIGTSQDRGARVELLIKIPDGIVKMALPGGYNITTPQIMELQSLPGMLADAA